MKVEFILAHEDGTWRTEVFNVPERCYRESQEEIVNWWHEEYGGHNAYRKIVFVGMYSLNPEEGL